MSCRRCPHHVRHGQLGADATVQFKDVCGLIVKQNSRLEEVKGKQKALKGIKSQECVYYPFSEGFDYLQCEVYQQTFKGSDRKNGVVPTKDIQYSEALSGGSITDMELL